MESKRLKIIYTLVLLFVMVLPCSAVAEPRGALIIFHAGSLSAPFEAMEKCFESRYPRVNIFREASGSQKAARKITELGKPCDVMASADYAVIDELLIPQHADWNILFATNQLVLCYTDRSRYADEIDPHNWYEILLREDTAWGHSDPNLDPCGYRSLMVMQLAEKYYNVPGLYKRLTAGRQGRHVRSKSTELISLLESGKIDFVWEYLFIAVQHDLRFVLLPDEINLGNHRYNSFYSHALVKVAGKGPGEFMELRGKSCTYGVTLLKNAPNREAAIAFMTYMLDPQGGLKVLDRMGQPPLIPCSVSAKQMKSRLPEVLQNYVKE
ncbi:tungstate ABC transporter substrate-binding protein WtpA [Desulfatiglans anilini]|uniref:tungstate ABC transporter substrate-binding protein WtpA n=1 Tax=Desulfatiglans anilini TaxID=90728 RepID=UPI000422BB6C|nr:tungstate ABC transporter substrate-binding protein WtpA [Desulfatiglans anilini]